MAGLIWAFYCYLAHLLLGTLDSNDFSLAFPAFAFAFAFVMPNLLLMACVAGALFAVAIRDWHGNVNRMLLLRLLDAQQKESDRADNGAKPVRSTPDIA